MKSVSLTNQSVNLLVARLSLPIGAFAILILIGLTSDELLGEYALVTTFYYVLQTLPLMGLMPFYMREVARSPEKAGTFFVSTASLTVLACIAINVGIYFLLPHSVYSESIQKGIQWVGLTIVPGILAFLAEITLTSRNQSKAVPKIAIVENIVRVIASTFVLFLSASVLNLVFALIFSRLFALICYLVVMWRLKIITHKASISISFLYRAKKVLPTFLLNSILALMLSRIDFIILSLLDKIEIVGYYAIAYRLFEIVGIATNAVISAIFPYWARTYHTNKQLFITHLRVFGSLAFCVMLITSAIAYIGAEWYIGLLFPAQYPSPLAATQLFMLLLLPQCLDQVLTHSLHACNQQGRDTKVLMLSAPLYVVTLLTLIPWYGLYGAVLSNAIVLLAQIGLRYYWLRHSLNSQIFSGRAVLYFSLSFLILSVVALTRLDDPLNEQVSTMLTTLFLILLALSLTRIFRPLSALSLYYARKARRLTDITNFSELVAFIAYDHLRYLTWWRKKMRGDIPISNLGFLACFFIRCSRYCYNIGYHRLARGIWHLNSFLTKTDIRPNIKIGPGLVLDAPVAVGITADLGHSSTFFAHAALGCSGSADAGAGPGKPMVGNYVKFRPRAYLLGGIKINNFADVESHAQIIKARQIEKL